MLTKNQRKVLRGIAVSRTDHSLNEVARMAGITPGGAHKMVKGLQKEGILVVKDIANITSYRLNFDHENTVRVLGLALSEPPEGRVAHRARDLERLRSVVQACIVFGSYTTSKQKPGDLDVLFILRKENFEEYKKELTKVRDIAPVKIHDVVQTREDLLQNLVGGDPIIVEALRNGVVLWGVDLLIEVIKDAY